MLEYPELDEAGRAKIWMNLIALVPRLPTDAKLSSRRAAKYRVAFSDEEYEELASRYKLNGRQIKNSIVLARALARERGTPLSMEVLDRAVNAVAGPRATSTAQSNGTY